MKPHLVLVHSFPTNSVLLHGLTEYLDEFFTVHFLDLPGFHEQSPPLKGTITLRKFSKYVEDYVRNLNVSEYIIGGVSFGFLVVNNARLDNRCRAILAMEPFINVQCLAIPYWTQKKHAAIAFVLSLFGGLHVERLVWQSEWFIGYLQRESGYSRERIHTIIRHLDPHTFFTVARILLTYRPSPTFHDLPYFLVGNFADDTIDFGRITQEFVRNIRELHIASEPIDHYPKNLTREYFAQRIPPEHVSRMIRCLNG